jgi:hypothetical protein
MHERRTLHRIDKAAGDGRLVRVRRKKGWDRLEGWIVAHSRKWLLMAVELDAGFNGHTLIRPSDIRSIEEGPSAKLVQQVLAAEEHWPLPRLAGIDLASTQTILTSLAEIAPLVSIHYEQDHPDECLIGVPRDFRRGKFRLRTSKPPPPSGTPTTQSSATARSAGSTSEESTSAAWRRSQVHFRFTSRPASGQWRGRRPDDTREPNLLRRPSGPGSGRVSGRVGLPCESYGFAGFRRPCPRAVLNSCC